MTRFNRALLWFCLILAALGGAAWVAYVTTYGDDLTRMQAASSNETWERVAVYPPNNKFGLDRERIPVPTTGPTHEEPVAMEAWLQGGTNGLYHAFLGTPIKVRFRIETHADVMLRFDTLYQGLLVHDAEPTKAAWRIWPGTKVTVSKPEKDRRTNLVSRWVDMTVALWQPPAPQEESTQPPAGVKADAPATPAPPAVRTAYPLVVEFLRCSECRKNDPDQTWVYDQLPWLWFNVPRLTDEKIGDYDFGSWDDALVHPSPLGLLLLRVSYALYAFTALLALVFLRNWLRRVSAPALVPAAVREFHEGWARMEAAKATESPIRLLDVAIRSLVGYRAGGAYLTNAELISYWDRTPRGPLVRQIFRVLSEVIADNRLGPVEEERLVQLTRQFVEAEQVQAPPRHWLARATLRVLSWTQTIKQKSNLIVRARRDHGAPRA